MMGFLGACAVGVLAGLLTGCGVGGGTVLVLYLGTFSELAHANISGVNLLYFLCTAPPALLSHLRNGLVSVKLGLLAAASGVAAAWLGAHLSHGALAQWVRGAMGVLFLVVGVKELLFAHKRDDRAPR